MHSTKKNSSRKSISKSHSVIKSKSKDNTNTLLSKSSSERTFTINNVYHIDGCPTKFTHNDYSGRYKSSSAQRSASKALTKLCSVKKIHGSCTLYIEMRETTQGSLHKLSAYHCKRIHLNKPIEVNGRMFHYKTKITPVDNIPTEQCKGSHKSSGRMTGYHSKSLKSHKHKSSTSHKTKSIINKVSNTMKSIKNKILKLC